MDELQTLTDRIGVYMRSLGLEGFDVVAFATDSAVALSEATMPQLLVAGKAMLDRIVTPAMIGVVGPN